MIWFKHYTNAHKGKVLQDLYAEFGVNAGHGLYFRFTEFLADKWDGCSEPRFRFLTKAVQHHLEVSPKKLQKFAEILSKTCENSFKFSGEFCEIYFPKMPEILHRDAIPSSQRQARWPKPGVQDKEEEKNNTCSSNDTTSRDDGAGDSDAKQQHLVGDGVSQGKSPVRNEVLLTEIRFRQGKEIKELESYLAALFDGVAPAKAKRKIPAMLARCDGSAEKVREIFEDLFQSSKIRTGEGLNGSKSAYITAAIFDRFDLWDTL